MKWGLSYSVHRPIAEVARLIERAASEAGIDAHCRSSTSTRIIMAGTQSAPWYSVIARRLPQRIRWTLEQTGSASDVTQRVAFHTWYVLLMVLDWLLAAWLLLSGHARITTALGHSEQSAIGALTTIVASIILFMLGWQLLIGPVSVAKECILDSLRRQAETPVDPVEIRTGAHSLQEFTFAVCYLAYFSLVLSASFYANGGLSLPQSWVGLLLAIGGGTALLCMLLSPIALQLSTVFTTRTQLMLPGMCSLLSAAFLAGTQASWLTAQSGDGLGHLLLHREMHRVLATASFDMTDDESAETLDALSEATGELTPIYRTEGWVCVVLSLFALALSATMANAAIRISTASWRSRQRVTRLVENPKLSTLLSSKGSMSVARALLGGFWVSTATLTVIAICIALTGAGHALLGDCYSSSEYAPVRMVNASVLYMCTCLGRPAGDLVIESIVRCLWIMLAAALGCVWVLSVIQLLVARWRLLRRLQQSAEKAEVCGSRASCILAKLCARVSIASPKLVMETSDHSGEGARDILGARSHVFGILGRQRFVELSWWCAQSLEDDELEALLGHEVAHMICGHSFIDNMVRLLARMTFLGDQCSRVLQLTFGYELAADRTAVERLRVAPRALIRCLWRVRHHAAAVGHTGCPSPQGIGALPQKGAMGKPYHEGKSVLPPIVHRWLASAELFLWQYISASRVGPLYWHPTIAERIVALRQLERHGEAC